MSMTWGKAVVYMKNRPEKGEHPKVVGDSGTVYTLRKGGTHAGLDVFFRSPGDYFFHILGNVTTCMLPPSVSFRPYVTGGRKGKRMRVGAR